jgi:nuclear pore complex protein Nup98-Nup96
MQPSERSRVLKLPLTEDLWLKHSVELSTSYYRNVIVTGR